MTANTASCRGDGLDILLQIRGTCMDPVLQDGESVRIRRTRWYFLGDMVVYYCPYQERCLAHRFLGYVPASGAWKCLTMPDHGVKPDVLVDPANIIGRVLDKENRIDRQTLHRCRALWRYFYWVARIAARKRD